MCDLLPNQHEHSVHRETPKERKPVVIPGYEGFSFYAVRQQEPEKREKKKNAPDDEPEPKQAMVWRMHEATLGLVILWAKTRPECARQGKTLLDLYGGEKWLERRLSEMARKEDWEVKGTWTDEN